MRKDREADFYGVGNSLWRTCTHSIWIKIQLWRHMKRLEKRTTGSFHRSAFHLLLYDSPRLYWYRRMRKEVISEEAFAMNITTFPKVRPILTLAKYSWWGYSISLRQLWIRRKLRTSSWGPVLKVSQLSRRDSQYPHLHRAWTYVLSWNEIFICVQCQIHASKRSLIFNVMSHGMLRNRDITTHRRNCRSLSR